MAAVLSAVDPLRKDRTLSFDDNALSFSPGGTDWRAKYNEVVDMLAETKAELDEFHHASKELEAELESELARTEQAQQDLKIKVSRAESERDDWKTKFVSLQTTHNTTTTSLQRELDRLRQDHQSIKVQLRELEMGNDDLERNERAISSSLADMEAKYSRVLEEKILLEQELLEKVQLEEEMQRLKDELRDANEENSVLKNKLSVAEAAAAAAEEASRQAVKQRAASDEDLLKTKSASLDLDLSELTPTRSSHKPNQLSKSVTSSALQRASLYTNQSPLAALKVSGFTRSATMSSLYSPTTSTSRLPTRGTPIRTSTSTTSTSTTASKNKGVQMVSEMRARVKNLEQRIHTKVPRLRMASIANRVSMSSNTSSIPSEDSSSVTSRTSTAKTSWESQRRTSIDSKRSEDSFEKALSKRDKENGGDSGWVLIMEDSPSPHKMMKKDQRRLSNPPVAPTAYRPTRTKSPSLSTGLQNPLSKSTIGPRRPQSRASGTSLSTATTGSSIPTPVSRPTTPTFLPIPTSSLYTSSGGFKRSTGPGGANPYNTQAKRASLGSSVSGGPSSVRDRNVTQPPLPRPNFDDDDGKALPDIPSHSNVTVRAKSTSTSSISAVLSKSRIGRPPSTSGRKSSGDANSILDIKDLRPRSGTKSGR